MKKILLPIVLLTLFLSLSCSSKQDKKSDFKPKRDYGYSVFEKAERQFNAQSYMNARQLYQEYLDAYPSGQMAPACIFKIGAIESQQGNYEEARKQFDRIIDQFPTSFFVADAKVEYLFTYYKEERYQDVIDWTEKMREGLPASHLLRVDLLTGDAFMALNRPEEAFIAHIRSDIDLNSKEGQTVSERIRNEIELLSDQDITLILNRFNESKKMGGRLFKLGKQFADEENFEPAIKMLTGYIASFPRHEGVPEALSLIETLNTKSRSSTFIVGCLLPLSGSYKTFGEKALKGIELALSSLEDPRIQSRIKLIIKDTASDPVKTTAAVRALHEEKAIAIIGPITNPETGAKEAQALKIPMIVLSQKSGLTDIGDHIFRNFITPEMQVKAITDYAFNELYLSRFAILYPEEKYGQTFMNLFRDQVVQHGGNVVGAESYKTSVTDFSGPLKRLLSVPKNPKAPDDTARMEAGSDSEAVIDFDAIFIPDEPKTAGLILPQLTYQNILNVRLLGTNLWHSDLMIKMAKDEVQGAIIPEGFFENSTLPHVRFFVDRFKTTYGETPGFIEAISYDTAAILFKVAEEPYANTREGVRQSLFKVSHFNGVTGSTSFTPKGEAEKELHLLTIQGDKFVEVEKRY